MDSQTLMMLSEQYVAHTYARYPVVLVRGKGTRVWDQEGPRGRVETTRDRSSNA